MASFNQFLREAKRKAFLLLPDKQTNINIFNWATEKGFDLTKSYSGRDIRPEEFDFHVTVICSTNDVFVPSKVVDIRPITTTVTGYDILGIEKKVPVWTVDKNKEMVSRREFIEDFYSVYDKWPEWKAHLSLSYNWNGTPTLEDLDIPPFSLTFDRVSISDM